MKTFIRSMAAVLLAMTVTLTADAGETFSETLNEGDSYRGRGSFDLAIRTYEAALGQAGDDTERALAFTKIAEVYADNLGDCDKGLEYARRAIALPAAPVGRVSALRVAGDCNMKMERDQAAVTLLEEADKLTGVDWIKPVIALKLGDAYRKIGKFEQAIGSYRNVLATDADNATKGVAQLNIGLTQQYNLNNIPGARNAYAEAERLNPSLGSEIADHRSRFNP
jgi:tetratricopeptide (TPR) repeat protein